MIEFGDDWAYPGRHRHVGFATARFQAQFGPPLTRSLN
jgi:hypothetical protein